MQAKAKSANEQIAMIIIDQMGGGTMLRMVGARYVQLGTDAAGNPGVELRLPKTAGFVRDGINSVRVVLDTATDTYTMTFAAIADGQADIKLAADGLTWDRLAGVFAATTGLATMPQQGLGMPAATAA